MACKNMSQQKDMLLQITKISDAIRQKHKILKVDKDTSEQTANEMFKAIKGEHSDYQTIYDNSDTHRGQNTYDDLNANSTSSSNLDETILSHPPTSTSTPLKYHNSISKYIDMLNKKNPKGLDTRFGIRKKNNQLFFNNSPVQFRDNIISVNNQNHVLSPGLIELLFKSDPNENSITTSDLDVYQKLIVSTNTHRENYESERSLYVERTAKYTKYIADFVQSPLKRGKGLPDLMTVSKKRKYVDYVYWDDPNELIDRLRLLIASQAAGNTSHSNEIISIIEELQEAKIIY
ncbi:uncharacterized protein LOC128668845 [Microplitis demolitor]|uniref:uncharacterized protein LOC128668845 n=1 Tax=Microplitis demolitor TaxID=69319 RepID=UPI00235B65E6|nr:uncharacterized protein LOC128668845 [Microplitis demolitor]